MAAKTSPQPPVGPPHLLQDFLEDTVGAMVALHSACGAAVTVPRSEVPTYFLFGEEFNRALHIPELVGWTSGLPGPRKSAQRAFMCGMFNLNGQQHQDHRRLLMPPFRKETLAEYHSHLVDITGDFLRGWQEGQRIDLARSMKDLTIRITGRVLFGLEDVSLARAIEPVFEEWLACNHRASFAAFLPVSGLQEWYDPLLEVSERFQTRVKELLTFKRERLGPPRDLLSILLHAQALGRLSEDEVIGQTHTLFNAAYHTTTYALTWTLFLLAQHPDVARALCGEIEEGLGGADPTMPELARLDLLDRVIKESLRLLPPVVYFARVLRKACDIGPYSFAPGNLLIGSHYMTHHHAETFPRPERFDPDRWLGASPSPYAYIPFGAGARLCIGAPFATLAMKIVVAMTMQRFRFTVLPGARIDRLASLTLGPRQPITMVLSRPDRRFSASPVAGNIHEMVELPRPQALPIAA